MKVLVCDGADVAGHAARRIADAARAAISERGRACLAFSGGKTPWAMLRALAEEDLPWGAIDIFQTDERAVAADDPDRTLAHLRAALLSRVPLRPDRVHPMPVGEADLAEAAKRYAASLERAAGTPAILDLVHLGLGADGHTASLIPGDPVLDVSDADVAVSGPYQGHRRMTLTYPILNRARAVLWLVTGDAKAEILRRLCAHDTVLPAGRVNPEHALVVADRAAARLLPANIGGAHDSFVFARKKPEKT